MPIPMLSQDFTIFRRSKSFGAATATGAGVYTAAGAGSSAGAASTFATAFDPTAIAGLKLWVAARLFNDKLDGDAIQTWPDKSGQGNDFSQSTSGARPLYKINAMGGRPALLFDAMDDYLTVPNFLSGFTAGEFFIVLKRTVETPPTTAKSGCWRFGSSSNACNWPFTDNTIYDDWGATVRKTTVNPTPALINPRVYNVSSAAGAWTSRLDGTQLFTTGTNIVGFTTTPTVGRSEAAGPSFAFFDGHIAEVLIYDNVLSGGDRTFVTDNLKAIYGIT